MAQPQPIDSSYEKFYSKRASARVCPTEFVVRTFLASYLGSTFRKPPAGDQVLDVAFGNGRNTVFLCDRGCSVSSNEITDGIVKQTSSRLERLGYQADLRVGRSSSIPFEGAYFDYILAYHRFYYYDEGGNFNI